MRSIEPKIRDYNGDLNRRWAVWVNVPGEHGPERLVFWISGKNKTKLERYAEADRIIKDIREKLSRGEWDKLKKELPLSISLQTAVKQALEFKQNYVSPRTYQSYSNIVERLLKWAKEKDLCNKRIDLFTISMLRHSCKALQQTIKQKLLTAMSDTWLQYGIGLVSLPLVAMYL